MNFRTILRLAVTACAVAAAAAAQAQGETVVLKVHHFLPSVTSAQSRLIQPWCDKIARESTNRLKCRIYPSMQLGGTPAQLFDQARDGVVDIVWTVPTYAAGRFTKSEVFELPWMAPDATSGSQALWAYVHKNALDEYKGVRPLFMHVHDGALFHIKGKQPRTLDEMKGLKLSAANRTNARMIAALGAAPVQMPVPAVPEAVAKGVVDGATVPWEGARSIKLDEIAGYALDVPEGAPRISNAIFLFGMNQRKYDSLPADLKKVIDANSGLAVSAWAGKVAFDDIAAGFRKAARERGANYHVLSDAEYQRWVKATESVNQQWIKEAGAKGADGAALLQDARAMIRQYAK